MTDNSLNNLIARHYVTSIFLIEKHKIYNEFKSIEHNTFKDELENSIVLMVGIVNLNSVKKIENAIKIDE